MRKRIAIITPWYGDECTGGAETLARDLAKHLSRQDDVTVLTTTSRSFLHEWHVDYHRAGISQDGDCRVRRFEVRPRNTDAFAQINNDLLGLTRSQWPDVMRRRVKTDPFVEESINSPSLEAYVKRHGGSYDAIFALPYLYGVVVRSIEVTGVPIHLIPCLHDEAYARIPRIEDAIHQAVTLLFNSGGEAELGLRLYGPGILQKSHVIGSGIPPVSADAGDTKMTTPYYLYLGRREPEKGVDFLVQTFARYRSNGGKDVALVVAGAGTRSYHDAASGIHDFGYVDEATKVALLRNAIALVNPSQNESYSRVLMEAWRENVPVVAHSACLATATAVVESGGGLLAQTAEEWIASFESLQGMPIEDRRALGRRGSAYASENADWERVVDRLRKATGLSAVAERKNNGKTIHQVLEAFDRGDAISDDARGIRKRLEALGYESKIFAVHPVPGVLDGAELKESSLSSADGIVYHHSIGSDAVDAVMKARGRKAVIYHNVTPSRFYAPYVPAASAALDRGRQQLSTLTKGCDLFVGDSEFNSNEMRALGAQNVRTIPVATEFGRFDVTPATRILRTDRGTTWLFVGRVAPNKGLHDLIDAFEVFLTLDEDASLIILGKFDQRDRYYGELKAKVLERRIDPYVTFTGYADEAAIVAYYRSASVFVCLSEHEGFCVPLLEAMFFDVPIVARAAGAVPGTLGAAGIVLEPDTDRYGVAAAVYELCNDAALRDTIISAQRERRRAFLPERVNPLIDSLARDLVPT